MKVEIVFKFTHESVKVRRDTSRMIANNREEREYLVISSGYEGGEFSDHVHVPVEFVPSFLQACAAIAEGRATDMTADRNGIHWSHRDPWGEPR